MSNLAQRIRDIRYQKGLGPDALAARAEISRTALYQIECGKTEVPRAGTLRRIARALDVPIDELLGYWPKGDTVSEVNALKDLTLINHDRSPTNDREWSYPDDPEVTSYSDSRKSFEVNPSRADLVQKLEDLLDSRFADSITKIIDETHDIMTLMRSQTISRTPVNGHARIR